MVHRTQRSQDHSRTTSCHAGPADVISPTGTSRSHTPHDTPRYACTVCRLGLYPSSPARTDGSHCNSSNSRYPSVQDACYLSRYGGGKHAEEGHRIGIDTGTATLGCDAYFISLVVGASVALGGSTSSTSTTAASSSESDLNLTTTTWVLSHCCSRVSSRPFLRQK